MNSKTEEERHGLEPRGRTDRRVRADAQRNIETLLHSAMTVFASSGVDAPVREIAEKAGVGIGTVYRHFPQRSDLIVGVFRHEVDACADAASVLAAEHESGEPLARWSGGFEPELIRHSVCAAQIFYSEIDCDHPFPGGHALFNQPTDLLSTTTMHDDFFNRRTSGAVETISAWRILKLVHRVIESMH